MSYRIGMTNTEDMAALPEKSGSGPVLKSDTLGRVRTPVGRRRELLAEFERSGLTTLGLSATAASATVTVGVGATAVIGTSQIAGDMAGSWGYNWNQVNYDAGLLTGGFAVGAAGAGRALGQGISGQPSSLAPSLNPFADTGLGYDSNFQNGSLLTWLGSAPTPSSGGAVIGLTSAGAASFIQQSSPGSWLTPSTGSSQNQSSSTGK